MGERVVVPPSRNLLAVVVNLVNQWLQDWHAHPRLVNAPLGPIAQASTFALIRPANKSTWHLRQYGLSPTLAP